MNKAQRDLLQNCNKILNIRSESIELYEKRPPISCHLLKKIDSMDEHPLREYEIYLQEKISHSTYLPAVYKNNECSINSVIIISIPAVRFLKI